eukprot:6824697-Prymnesium_polylepis.1
MAVLLQMRTTRWTCVVACASESDERQGGGEDEVAPPVALWVGLPMLVCLGDLGRTGHTPWLCHVSRPTPVRACVS